MGSTMQAAGAVSRGQCGPQAAARRGNRARTCRASHTRRRGARAYPVWVSQDETDKQFVNAKRAHMTALRHGTQEAREWRTASDSTPVNLPPRVVDGGEQQAVRVTKALWVINVI